MQTKEEIKKVVRQTYGNVATQGGYQKDSLAISSCCGSTQSKNTENQASCGCGGKEVDVDQMATFLGYSIFTPSDTSSATSTL